MRRVRFKPRCVRDLANIKKRNLSENRLYEALDMLMHKGRLPIQFRPHKLSGTYAGLWECHLASDWLLVYDVSETEVIVYRTGSHADLFE